MLLIYTMKLIIASQWSLSLIHQCPICLSPLWSQLSYWPLECYLLNYSNYCQVKNEAFFSLTSFFFPHPLQDGINGSADFALSSLHCLGLAILTLWVLAYALHSISWNPDDHLARRLWSNFSSVIVKIEMQSASCSTVGREWVDYRTSLHEIFLSLCVLFLCFLNLLFFKLT